MNAKAFLCRKCKWLFSCENACDSLTRCSGYSVFNYSTNREQGEPFNGKREKDSQNQAQK